MATGDKFSAAVKDWCDKTEIKQTEILHASLRSLAVELEHDTPIITGNTRNSIALSTLGMPAIDWSKKGGKKFRNNSDEINNAVAGVAIGQKAWLGFRAPWAHSLEPKYAMVRLAAQRWKQIVDAAASKLRGK